MQDFREKVRLRIWSVGTPTMTDDLAWVLLIVQQPQDRQLVYARAKYGTPKKVVFYVDPARWIGANIVYRYEYFREWAPIETDGQTRARVAS